MLTAIGKSRIEAPTTTLACSAPTKTKNNRNKKSILNFTRLSNLLDLERT
jgi:hypothetical protein